MHYAADGNKRAIALYGKCIVVSEANDYFGGEGSKPYMSQILDNPTWGKLFSCAKAQQKQTKDEHHCFFEGYFVTKHIDIDGFKPVAIIKLALGS